MTRRSLIAVCQLTATHDIEKNFAICADLLRRASSYKAKVAFLPECFDYVGRSKEESVGAAHAEEGDLIGRYRVLAKELGLWISLGGFHEKDESGSGKTINSHIMINANGDTVSKYRKLHLFNVDIPGGVRLMENDFTVPGTQLPPVVDTPAGQIGLGTCYDLRFPLFSSFLREKGAEILTYPSAFTLNTGLAHWEALLRARAIENQCYVVASAQSGSHNEKRKSYGHAMVVDPWGVVTAQCGDGSGLCLAEINLDYLDSVRKQMPCFENRRTDLFQLSTATPGSSELWESGPETYNFGGHTILKSSVFYRSPLVYSLVNRNPVVEGHVMCCPLRAVERLTDLGPAEIAELFQTVQKVEKAMLTYYGVDGATISVQDGEIAGQTVKHVHVHILPRRPGDFPGDNNDIYKKLEATDRADAAIEATGGTRKEWRTEEEMAIEAEKFRNHILKSIQHCKL